MSGLRADGATAEAGRCASINSQEGKGEDFVGVVVVPGAVCAEPATTGRGN